MPDHKIRAVRISLLCRQIQFSDISNDTFISLLLREIAVVFLRKNGLPMPQMVVSGDIISLPAKPERKFAGVR